MSIVSERVVAAHPPPSLTSTATALAASFSTARKRRVLIVEDDPFVRDIAQRLLVGPGCRVAAVNSVDGIEGAVGLHKPDLVVVGSVEAAGGDLSSRLRHAFHMPVIPLFRPSIYAKPRKALTARSGPLLGALADCRVRMDQHLRVSAPPSEVSLRWGDFTVRLEAGAFAFQGQDIGMTAVESAILYLLMRHAGELMGHGVIAQAIFRKPRSQSNFIPVHISRIRAKLRAARSDIFIENIRGEGYVLFWSPSFGPNGIPGLEVL